MRDEFHERGQNLMENRSRLPLISEDTAKNEFMHQDVRDDGIVTVCQKVVTGFTAKQLAIFGYEIERFFIPISDNKAVFKLV